MTSALSFFENNADKEGFTTLLTFGNPILPDIRCCNANITGRSADGQRANKYSRVDYVLPHMKTNRNTDDTIIYSCNMFGKSNTCRIDRNSLTSTLLEPYVNFGQLRDEGSGTWVNWFWDATDLPRISKLKIEARNLLKERYENASVGPSNSNDGESTMKIRAEAEQKKTLHGLATWRNYLSFRSCFDGTDDIDYTLVDLCASQQRSKLSSTQSIEIPFFLSIICIHGLLLQEDVRMFSVINYNTLIHIKALQRNLLHMWNIDLRCRIAHTT